MFCLSKPSDHNGYTRMEEEDPEEVQHRRAQFLIYKSLQKADSMRKSTSCLKVKVCRLKIKIGRRLKRLRKSIVLGVSVAKGGFYKPIINHLRSWKRLLRTKNDNTSSITLPPIMF